MSYQYHMILNLMKQTMDFNVKQTSYKCKLLKTFTAERNRSGNLGLSKSFTKNYPNIARTRDGGILWFAR